MPAPRYPLANFCCVVLLLVACSAACFGQPTATGIIEGRIFNETSGNYLNNARVTVEGGTREAFSDQSGFYRLTEVPSGEVRVRASTPAYARLRTVGDQRRQFTFGLRGTF